MLRTWIAALALALAGPAGADVDTLGDRAVGFAPCPEAGGRLILQWRLADGTTFQPYVAWRANRGLCVRPGRLPDRPPWVAARSRCVKVGREPSPWTEWSWREDRGAGGAQQAAGCPAGWDLGAGFR